MIHSPRSLKFTGASRTLESLLKEIFSASLGLSVEEVCVCTHVRKKIGSSNSVIFFSSLQDAEWDGLSIIDPFTTPEAVVEIYIDGVSSLGNLVRCNIIFKVKSFYTCDL